VPAAGRANDVRARLIDGVQEFLVAASLLRQENVTFLLVRFARYFGTSAAVWLRLQARYDLEVAENQLSERINREVKVLNQTPRHV
jgi:plasmid maintenance system antidote protein VapI